MPELKPKWTEKSVNEKGAIVLLQNVRLASCFLAAPQIWKEPPGADYNVQALIPKGMEKAVLAAAEKTITAIVEQSKKVPTAAAKKALIKAATKWGGSESIFKDGDKTLGSDGNPVSRLSDSFFLRAKTKCKDVTGGEPVAPFKLYDKFKKPVPREEIQDQFYPGCYADVQIQVKVYQSGKNIGITCYLSGVMKTANGERLGGVDVFEVRDDLPDEDDAFEVDSL